MQIVVVVGVEHLTHERQEAGECNQAPHSLSERSRAARGQPARNGRQQRRESGQPVSPNRSAIGAEPAQQKPYMPEDQNACSCQDSRAIFEHHPT